MAKSQDTEITLGTGKLLGLFFGLVIVCAVFFALGYSLGRKTDMGLMTASAGSRETASNAAKVSNAASPAAPMTFYKNVEQKDANDNAQLAPAPTEAAASTSATVKSAIATSDGAKVTPTAAADPMTAPSSGTYTVQVAAVTKQEDAESLVEALKQKQYPAFVAVNLASDKYVRVQVGPFSDIKDAEAMRTRLVGDGYNPILKK